MGRGQRKPALQPPAPSLWVRSAGWGEGVPALPAPSPAPQATWPAQSLRWGREGTLRSI